MSRKANIISTLLLITVLLSFSVIMYDLNYSGSSDTRVDGLKADLDAASNSVYSAAEGAVLLAVRDYALLGFSNQSAVWVENINLIPDDIEREKAMFYHLNKSIMERFQNLVIKPEGSQDYEVDLSQIEIELKMRQYPDANGNMHDGFEIQVNDVKLESLDPVGHKYFNYTFNFPDLWVIYDGLKEYVESPATKSMFDAINALTKDTVCSDQQCQCGAGFLPGVDPVLDNNKLKLSDVEDIVHDYADDLILHMQMYGIECTYTSKVDVENKVSTDIIASGPMKICPPASSYQVTAKSPDMWVWSPEEGSYPSSPLPYYGSVPGVYDYTPALRESFPRESSNPYAGWPVNLKTSDVPKSGASGGRAPETGAEVIMHRLWRGAAGLLDVQCKDPAHFVLGADPDNPHEISNLQSRIFVRLNTLAPCPSPHLVVDFDDFDQNVVSTCPIYCWKLVCAPGGGACIPDDLDAPDPTKEPCEEIIYIDMPCTECAARSDCTCTHKACPDCPLSGEEEVPNPAYDPSCDPTTTTCEPENIMEDCCDGDCSMYGAECRSTDDCSCETTVGDKLMVENPDDCNLIKKCFSGDTICACSCFTAGTMVTMADRTLKPIEDVAVGEQVLGFDEESGKQIIGTVAELESPWREGFYNVYLKDGTVLNVTNEHPLYARGDGYVGWAAVEPKALDSCYGMASYRLQVGDELFKEDATWQEITGIIYMDKPVRTYNLKTVVGSQNFYADGVLAHNEGKPTCFPAGTRVSMADGTTKPIEDVNLGDVVYSFDAETGKPKGAVVLEIESPIRHGYYDLFFGDGTVLNITNEHPIWIKSGEYEGWAAIEPYATFQETGRTPAKLEVGDYAMNIDGEWLMLENIVFVNKTVRAYNIKRMMGADNYYVNGVSAEDLADQTDNYRPYYAGSIMADPKPPAEPGPSHEDPADPLPDPIDEW